MTLNQIVRDQIGAEGPQLPSDEYEERIESELARMKPDELLRLISQALADAGIMQ